MKDIQNAYDYKKFLYDDACSYKTTLENLPYRPELQALFLSFKRQHRAQLRRDQRHLAYPCSSEHISQTGLPEKQAIENETKDLLHAAIHKLPEKQRRRIFAYFFKGRTYGEIAHGEGVSITAVAKSIYAALRVLKKEMGNFFKEG